MAPKRFQFLPPRTSRFWSHCRCRRFFGALPEFLRGGAESAFCPDDADRDWFRLRSDAQNLYSVSETVTKSVRTNGDPGSCFDGRNNARRTIVLLHHPRFLFHLRKDHREIIVVIRIIFTGQANQRFGRNLGNRNGAPFGKRMVWSHRRRSISGYRLNHMKTKEIISRQACAPAMLRKENRSFPNPRRADIVLV